MYRLVAALLVSLLSHEPACADAISFSPTTEKAGWRILARPGSHQQSSPSMPTAHRGADVPSLSERVLCVRSFAARK